jgi:parallel beta-helix repeat protein
MVALFLFFVVFVSIPNATESISNTIEVFKVNNSIDTIDIRADSDFVTYGLPGEGSEENPYIIENLSIESTGGFSKAISISGTTAHFIIRNCFIEHAYFGIYIRDIEWYTSQIINNTCIGTTNESIGIVVSGFNGGIITKNTCINSGQGIRTIYANFITITENKISNCIFQGINIHHCHFNNITYNVIKNCMDFGVALVGSITYSILVHHNDFIDNAKKERYDIDGELSGFMTSQGYDNGVLNKWYEEESKTGNYWSDHIEKGNYSIDGSAESVDIYPKKKEINRSSFQFVVTLAALIALISVSVLFRRKT